MVIKLTSGIVDKQQNKVSVYTTELLGLGLVLTNIQDSPKDNVGHSI